MNTRISADQRLAKAFRTFLTGYTAVCSSPALSEDGKLVDTFRKLLSEYCAHVSLGTDSNDAHRFKEFVETFSTILSSVTRAEAAEAGRDRRAFETFFLQHRAALQRWRTEQEESADDFKLFGVMELTDRETAIR